MRLYINVDHVATVRQARRTDEPDPIEAAELCIRGGADGITVHLREDRRHIQEYDVRRLAERRERLRMLNLELAAVEQIVRLATELRPHQATLVPERREEITTEGGLNLGAPGTPPDGNLVDAINQLQTAGLRVSLFIDPEAQVIDRAVELGVEAIELHTGDYANTYMESDAALERLKSAVQHARAAHLAVHAGHGLTYRNVKPVAAIGQVEELNIGHSIVSRSIMVGMEAAVREMRALTD